jgi:hypothetical protein
MADETPIQVLKEPGRRPQSKSYVWLVRTGEDGEVPIILYNYTPTRAGKNVEAFLKDAEAGFYLMVDGYQGYNKLIHKAKRCCCWTHIRRYLIQAIPKGQYEAAKTLGMNYVQTMRRIILPQVFKIILPPVSNETITLVKDTSLIYVLAMNDLPRTTRNLVQRDFNIMPFVVAGVFYLVMTLILTYGFNKLEKHFARWD